MSNQYKNQKEKWIREGYENAKLDLKMNKTKGKDMDNLIFVLVIAIIVCIIVTIAYINSVENYNDLKENNHIIPKGFESVWTSFEDNETIIVLDSNDEMNKQIITQLNQYLQYKAQK